MPAWITSLLRDGRRHKGVDFKTPVGTEVKATFNGTITGVTEWGLYVEEKDTRTEGLVRIRDLGNDFYILDQKNYCLVGQRTKNKFSLLSIEHTHRFFRTLH